MSNPDFPIKDSQSLTFVIKRDSVINYDKFFASSSLCVQFKHTYFQVTSKKRTIRHNLPIQIGFFVYSYAKLRMLSFYYDVLVRYIPRPLFSLCEMDTGFFISII